MNPDQPTGQPVPGDDNAGFTPSAPPVTTSPAPEPQVIVPQSSASTLTPDLSSQSAAKRPATFNKYSASPAVVSDVVSPAAPTAFSSSANSPEELAASPQPADATPPTTPNNPMSAAGPAGPAPKSNKRWLKLGLVGLGLTLLIGSAVVFGWYLPNQPENVWRTGLDRTGETLDNLIIEATEEEKLEKLTNTELTGNIEVEGEDFKINGNLQARFDPEDSDTKINVKYNYEGVEDAPDEGELDLNVLTKIAESNTFPDVYFKLSGFNELGFGRFLPGLEEVENRWLELPASYIESIISAEELAESQEQRITHQDVSEVARTVSGVTREYVFSSDEDKAVLVMDEFIGTEETEEGVKANRYKVHLHKDNAKKYCRALTEAIIDTDVYARFVKDSEAREKDKENARESCDSDLDYDDFEKDTRFEMWIDRKYKLVHKVRLANKDDAGDYVDIGQKYTGGDMFSLFVAAHSDKDKFDTRFTVDVDTEQTITKGTFTHDSRDENSPLKVNAQLEFKPAEGDVNVERPEGTIRLEELLESLGFSFTDGPGVDRSAPSSVQGRAMDTER